MKRRTLRLLLVEDSESDARIIVREIERIGFELDCVRVDNESDFVASLDSDLDLIITDYRLPCMSADQVISEVRNRAWDIPILIVSGYIDDATAAGLVREGAWDFLLKDRLARLGIAIESALSKRQSDAEKRIQYKILEESESRLSLALDTANLAVLTWQLHPERCTMDTRWAQLVGMQMAEVGDALTCWIERTHPDDRGAVEQNLEAIRQGTVNHFSLNHRLRNVIGDWLWVVCKARVVRLDELNNPVRVCVTFQDITDFKNSIDELEHKTRMLDVIRVAQHELLEHYPSADGFNSLLEGVLSLTGSEYGFIGLIYRDHHGNPYLESLAITNIAWNEETRAMMANLGGGQGLQFTNLNTLFGAVMTTGNPVLSNSPSSDPRSGGIPPGHPPLRRFLGLPIKKGNELIGMLGVANRAEPYDFEVISSIEPFIQTCAQLISAWTDHRQRDHAERKILESEKHFRNLAETPSLLIWTTTPSAEYDYLNPACLAFGVDRSRTGPPENWLDSLVDEDRMSFDQLLKTRCEHHESLSAVVRAVNSYGDLRWLQIEGNPRFDMSGKFLGYVFYGLDITRRVRAEQKEQETDEVFRQLFELAPDAILVVRDDWIIRANRCGMELFSAGSLSPLGLRFGDLVTRPDDGNLQEIRAMRAVGRRLDGTPIPLELSTATLTVDDEEVVLVYARDLTAQQEAEQRVQAELHEKELLLKEVHHRVKNNLQVISSLLNLQMDEVPGPQQEVLKDSVGRVRTMALIHEHLYCQHGADSINLGEYLDSLLGTILNSYTLGASVERRFALAPIKVSPDVAIPVGLIINELIANVMKHAFDNVPSPCLWVSLAAEPDHYLLEVADNGKGLPPDFEIQSATTLGMTIISKLASQIRAELTMETSERTCFRFRFGGAV